MRRDERLATNTGDMAGGAHCRGQGVLLQYSDQSHTMDETRGIDDSTRGQCQLRNDIVF
jgi:hypothetical protein